MGIEPKALLILDNCSPHPDEELLVSADGIVIYATFCEYCRGIVKWLPLFCVHTYVCTYTDVHNIRTYYNNNRGTYYYYCAREEKSRVTKC